MWPPEATMKDRDNAQPEQEDGEQDGVLCLGFRDDTYYYFSRTRKDVIPLKAREHNEPNLLMLAPLGDWLAGFPSGPRPGSTSRGLGTRSCGTATRPGTST